MARPPPDRLSGSTTTRTFPGRVRGRRGRVLRSLAILLLGATGCRPPALVPTFAFDAPTCDAAVVGVIDSVSARHTEAEIRDAVLATGWAAEVEPTVVVVDRAPVLQNPEAVAEAMMACYPRPLRFHGISGSCRFAVLVDPTGRIADARLSRAALFSEFNEAGAAVLGMMRFSPALYDGCRPYYWSELDLTFVVPPR